MLKVLGKERCEGVEILGGGKGLAGSCEGQSEGKSYCYEKRIRGR